MDVASDGQEGLEKVTSGTEYDLIFMDYSMPKMDGLNASFRIREFYQQRCFIERRNQPKIIGLTGNCSNEAVQNGTLAGMDKVNSKPLYYEDFKNIV